MKSKVSYYCSDAGQMTQRLFLLMFFSSSSCCGDMGQTTLSIGFLKKLSRANFRSDTDDATRFDQLVEADVGGQFS